MGTCCCRLLPASQPGDAHRWWCHLLPDSLPNSPPPPCAAPQSTLPAPLSCRPHSPCAGAHGPGAPPACPTAGLQQPPEPGGAAAHTAQGHLGRPCTAKKQQDRSASVSMAIPRLAVQQLILPRGVRAALALHRQRKGQVCQCQSHPAVGWAAACTAQRCLGRHCPTKRTDDGFVSDSSAIHAPGGAAACAPGGHQSSPAGTPWPGIARLASQ